MTDYPKTEAPLMLGRLAKPTDLRTNKDQDGIYYEAIFEVLHHGKEALLPRLFHVDKMCVTDFSLLITSKYPKTLRALCISEQL
jgi:hypothetical protein